MQAEHHMHEALVKPGCASTCAVRASTATERKSSVGAGVGVRVTNHTLSSSSAGDANCTHGPGAAPARWPAPGRGWRAACWRAWRGLDLSAQQVADFVVKDQRQAGDAQQQHEDGAPGWTTCGSSSSGEGRWGSAWCGAGSAGCAGARPQGQPAVQGGQGGVSSGEEGVVQARQPENIERRWALAAAFAERI